MFRLILFTLFFLDYSIHAQTLEVLEDVVTFTFCTDTLGDEVYFLAEKDFGGVYFVEDITYIVEKAYFSCDKLIQISQPKMYIFELPHFQNQNKERNIYYSTSLYTHYGGDVFKTTKDTILITFQMKAKVLKLDGPICKGFLVQSPHYCIVKEKEAKYPIYVIADVLEAKSLDTTYLKKKRLTPYRKPFQIGSCY